MKQKLKYFLLLALVVGIWTGCKRDTDYYVSTPSAFIANFDLKKLYKETDLTLNAQIMGGATSIKGVVISDFRAGNSPAGLLIMQNSRLAGNGIDSLRGMAFNLGADAAKYIPGDSVHIKVDGAVLKRVNGILQITGITDAAVSKISSGRTLKVQAVNTARILDNPSMFESTLVTFSNAIYEPEPTAGSTYAGDRIINDGYGKATIHTEASASFASSVVLPTGNFTGIPLILGTGTSKNIQFWMRSENDFFFVALPKFSPAIISGYLVDPNGDDFNNEYIQFIATKDIDFAVTPMSVITTNNAGASVFPAAGWATGLARTYKFNLTTGFARKGEYFYVGGDAKRINGSPTLKTPSTPLSTDISSANWIVTRDYSAFNSTGLPGFDGIGNRTDNLLANSGNIAGIAIFEGTNINTNSIPLDVIFYGGSGGNFYSAGPPTLGYRITNTDLYGIVNPLTRGAQLYMGAGTNTTRLGFPTSTSFAKLGGSYGSIPGAPQFGRWSTGRSLKSIPLIPTSQISLIEDGGTTLVN